MGNDLIQDTGSDMIADQIALGIRTLPWLDTRTTELICLIANQLVEHHPEVTAVILFGSIARHDERPLTDSEPSDVDLLLLVEERLPEGRALAIHHTIGETAHTFGYTPRDVQPLLVERDFANWDPLFVENIARDGILLWARGPLPAPLAAVAARIQQMSAPS
jgi:predicted nucleotidyltransferase